MPGLSSDLYQRCRKALLKCSEFDSDASLRAVFVTDELYPFRNRLPTAASKTERVDACLDLLLRQRFSDGRAILPLFLATLRDRYLLGDALHDELAALAEATRFPLDLPEIPSPEGESSSESHPQGTTYITHIDHAEGIAIGDGAQVVRSEPRAPEAAAPPGVSVTLLTETETAPIPGDHDDR